MYEINHSLSLPAFHTISLSFNVGTRTRTRTYTTYPFAMNRVITFDFIQRYRPKYRQLPKANHMFSHAIFTCRTQILLSDCMAVLISRTSFAANANYENLFVAPRTVYIMLHAIPFHFNHLMDIAKLNHIKRKKCWIFHLLFQRFLFSAFYLEHSRVSVCHRFRYH